METKLMPAPGFVIVQLGEYYEGVKMPENKYDTKTEGVVLKANPKEGQSWARNIVGKRIFWGEYREGKRTNFEGQQTATIRIEDIESYET